MNSRYIIVAILMHSLFGSSIAMAAEQNDLRKLKAGRVCVKCDLRSANLAGIDLGRKNMSGANLQKADLSGAKIEMAVISGEIGRASCRERV